MKHQDHVNLLQQAIPQYRGNSPHRSNKNDLVAWADLGSGEGAFTLALADLLPSESIIYSIDKNGLSLKAQEANFRRQFPFFTVKFLQLDFTKKLPFEDQSLDGILMANSLHFVGDKIPVLKNLKKLLKPGGRMVFVEYNVDEGNTWVPYPFSFEKLKSLAKQSGFKPPHFAGTVPSQFLNEMYCACAGV